MSARTSSPPNGKERSTTRASITHRASKAAEVSAQSGWCCEPVFTGLPGDPVHWLIREKSDEDGPTHGVDGVLVNGADPVQDDIAVEVRRRRPRRRRADRA